jgi:hypothetical protein
MSTDYTNFHRLKKGFWTKIRVICVICGPLFGLISFVVYLLIPVFFHYLLQNREILLMTRPRFRAKMSNRAGEQTPLRIKGVFRRYAVKIKEETQNRRSAKNVTGLGLR